MRLKTRKLLLNLAAAGCLAGGAAVAALIATVEPAQEDEALRLVAAQGNPESATQVPVEEDRLDPKSPAWRRQLRRPLYDPPPPPKKKVVKKVRPITVTLMGTVLEPNNSQAFVRQQNGSVNLKRVGDQLTADALDGVITEITPGTIRVRREDDEVEIKAQVQN